MVLPSRSWRNERSTEQIRLHYCRRRFCGAVLATRLSENPALDILLLEAGSKDTNPLIHIRLVFTQ